MLSRPVLAAFCLAALLPAAAPAAVITSLGALAGGDSSSFALGISADGSVVVGQSSSAAGPQSFRWTQSGGMVGLGFVAGGQNNSGATAASADGSVVVGLNTYPLGAAQAFRWTQSGGTVGLGYLGGASVNTSSAQGVSADGSTIVGYSYTSGGSEAFRWTAGGGMVGLGHLAGDNTGYARGISADGSVIVGGSGFQAARYAGGTVQGLGYLAGGSYSEAYAVSGDGSTIVGYGDSTLGYQAFRWTSGGGMQGLGIAAGGSESSARAVSADGSIVVGYNIFGSEDSSYGEAYVWDAVNGMQNLQAVLQAQGADLTGWSRLGVAYGISADGTKIAGLGTYNGVSQAFLAELSPSAVPEPSSFALLALVAGGWQWRRSRCRAATRI